MGTTPTTFPPPFRRGAQCFSDFIPRRLSLFRLSEEPKDDVDDSADNFKNHYIPDKLDRAKLLKQNQELIDYFNNVVGNPKYIRMLQGRKKLPAWNAGPSILDTLRTRQVCEGDEGD